MIRKIIEIDESRCNGCGACAKACHEGAIGMVNGVAKLLREDYCDGLGDCLPACPMDAIRFVEREAPAYDAAAVQASRERAEGTCSCAGSAPRTLAAVQDAPGRAHAPGRLGNWPVQIQLAPVKAPYFEGAHLLIAADCTAYAYGAFHEEFILGRTTLIACPKLDGVNYAEKLTAILASNAIRSITLVRMQVPCCGGLERMLQAAVENSGINVPVETVVIGMDGSILSRVRADYSGH